MCTSDILTWGGMRYCFDLDGTICHTPLTEGGQPNYLKSTKFPYMVDTINRLYDEGNHIIIMTARGRGSGINWTFETVEQLERWGVKYHEIEPMFHKPNADIFIDDKGINVEEWKKHQPLKRGIIAGSFDVIHPGYVRMFKYAKEHCNHLVIALHIDPSIDREWKMKPVQSVEDRREILMSLRDVDGVVVYDTEKDFLDILESGEYHVRFLGDDYQGGSYTGGNLDMPVIWVPRTLHNYSTTKLKQSIAKSLWSSH